MWFLVCLSFSERGKVPDTARCLAQIYLWSFFVRRQVEIFPSTNCSLRTSGKRSGASIILLNDNLQSMGGQRCLPLVFKALATTEKNPKTINKTVVNTIKGLRYTLADWTWYRMFWRNNWTKENGTLRTQPLNHQWNTEIAWVTQDAHRSLQQCFFKPLIVHSKKPLLWICTFIAVSFFSSREQTLAVLQTCALTSVVS